MRESAEGGYPPAMSSLANLYSNQLDRFFDPVRAYAWYALALRRTDPDDEKRRQMEGGLKGITWLLSPGQLTRAKELTEVLDKQTPRSKFNNWLLESCSPSAPPSK